jgi:2-C-methyl-D-erythritol 4-phosphate cytidylyltransferase
MSVSVIIPAGGIGKRFGSNIPKQFVEISGIPILIHTVRIFDDVQEVDDIVVSVHSEYYTFTKELLKKYGQGKIKEVVVGGLERQDSVYNALHTKTISESDIVLVHDAVRPFCTPKLVKRIIATVEDTGAAIPTTKTKETIKEISHKNEVIRTVDRSKLCMVQTPQGFWYDILSNAYEKAKTAGFFGTDSASLVEFIGYKITVVDGEDSNLKITTPFDLKVGQLIFDEKTKKK